MSPHRRRLLGLLLLLIGVAIIVLAIATVTNIDVSDSEGGPYVVIGGILIGGLGLLCLAGGIVLLGRSRPTNLSK